MSLPSIGFIGVGLMGSGMAGCMLNAGHPVRLLAHKNRAYIDPLRDLGATEVSTAAKLVKCCDVLFTCLPSAEIVETLADDLVPGFRAGQIWVDTTTSRPELSEHLAVRLEELGAIFADAPVTGGPEQAADGMLVSLVGCDNSQYPAISSLVGVYSKTVRRFGVPGQGHAAKLLNNLVTQGTTLLLADAFQCATRMGMDVRSLHDVMINGAARSGTLEKVVTPALDGKYDGAKFTIANAAKDLRYASDLLRGRAAERASLAEVIAGRLSELEARGRGTDFVSTMLDPHREN